MNGLKERVRLPWMVVTAIERADAKGFRLEPHRMPDPKGYVIAGKMPTNIKYVVVNTPEAIEAAVADLEQHPVVAFDVETTGLSCFTSRLLLMQLATPSVSYIFDAANQLDQLQPLRRVLSNKKVLKLGQNIGFDFSFTDYHLGIKTEYIYDTRWAERLLTAGLGDTCDLATLSKKYLGYYMDKSVRDGFIDLGKRESDPRIDFRVSTEHLTPKLLKYAAEDTLALFPIYLAQRKLLQERNLETIAHVEFECVAAVSEMQMAGCLINREAWDAYTETQRQKATEAERELLEDLLPNAGSAQLSLFDDSKSYVVNISSGDQIKKQFAKLGVLLEDVQAATTERLEHAAGIGLDELIQEGFVKRGTNIPSGQEVLIAKAAKDLNTFKKSEKFVTAFGEKLPKLINPVTGRIHSSYNQMGAETGRFSSTNPNLQNQSRTPELRACFVAGEGNVLIVADYSQTEIRILAELAQSKFLIDSYHDPDVDIYKMIAARVLGIDVKQVTKEQRTLYKTVTLGLSYGLGAPGLAIRTGISKEKAQEVVQQYFDSNPEIKQYLDRVTRQAQTELYSVDPVGRRRYYVPIEQTGLKDENEIRARLARYGRQGKNFAIQSASATTVKCALILLRERLDPTIARTINCVHDECIVECKEEYAEEVAKIVEQAMVEAGRYIVKSLPVVAEPNISKVWAK